jgi:multiple sugar transport system permease protein
MIASHPASSGRPVVSRTLRSGRVRVPRKLVPYLYVAPTTLLLIALMLIPIARVIRDSFLVGAITKKNPTFAGFDNYATLFANPVFWQATGQTLYFTLMSMVFHLVIGLVFALLLNSPLVPPVVRGVLRGLYILPWLFTAVIIAIVWRLMLDPSGIVNEILLGLNIIGERVLWLSSTNTALHALTFINIWAGYPLYMVSLLAGLQGISKDLYEAARIDGAGPVQRFWYVTLPQLKPIIISIGLLDFIWTMQVFPLVWMTTGGGPVHATEVLSTFTYKLAFSSAQFSQASASAIIILILSMSVTCFYIRHQLRAPS